MPHLIASSSLAIWFTLAKSTSGRTTVVATVDRQTPYLLDDWAGAGAILALEVSVTTRTWPIRVCIPGDETPDP
jgi:hypothetical protein